MAHVTDKCMKQRVVIELLTAEEFTPIHIYRCLNSVFGEWDVGVRHFKSCETQTRDKPWSSWHAVAVTVIVDKSCIDTLIKQDFKKLWLCILRVHPDRNMKRHPSWQCLALHQLAHTWGNWKNGMDCLSPSCSQPWSDTLWLPPVWPCKGCSMCTPFCRWQHWNEVFVIAPELRWEILH
jgi:hypothetical protein